MTKPPSTYERADLIRSLEAAEARVEAGESIDYDPNTFRDRLVKIYKSKTR